jgi:hypothetical protein
MFDPHALALWTLIIGSVLRIGADTTRSRRGRIRLRKAQKHADWP